MKMTLFEKLGITPGPWFVQKRYPGIYDVIGPVESRGEYCSDNWIDCSDDDARLIAQAPAMLEALIEWGVYAERFSFVSKNDKNPFGIIESATGKTWDEIKELSRGHE
jgi:hypothetical protein